jgi:hypothetical protein
MIQSVLNIVPWIKQLYTDFTTARAAKLDNLDTTISSRAAAATALSTATWTGTRAAKLDNLDVLLSTRLSSIIKSVQYKSLTNIPVSGGNVNGTVTITSVNTAKTLLIPMLRGTSETGGMTMSWWQVSLESATSLRVTGSVTSGSFASFGTVIVVEFY